MGYLTNMADIGGSKSPYFKVTTANKQQGFPSHK